MSAARTILLVEDNPLTRKMFRVALESEGYDVLEAGDGAAALSAVEGSPPGLVVQDLGLPDMDGISLLAELRALPAGRELPVIAASGLDSVLDEAPTGSQGFAERLLKPVNPSELVGAVAAHLPPPPEEAGEAAGGGRLLIADSDAARRGVLAARAERAGFEVEAVADGDAALEACARSRPDAVLCAAVLDGVDGFELCRRLRSTDGPPTRVVIHSSVFRDEADSALARGCGASALVSPDAGGSEAIEAVSDALRATPPDPADDDAIRAEHVARLQAQLRRQVEANRRLARRAELQTVPLSVLAGVTGTLADAFEVEGALHEVLTRCSEVEEIKGAAVFLSENGSGGSLAAAVGALDGPEGARELFGHKVLVADAIENGERFRFPSEHHPLGDAGGLERDSGLRSLLVEPLDSAGERVGALVLGSTGTLGPEHGAFAHAVAGQIADTIALARTLSRLRDAREQTILRLARAAEFRDDQTARHTERMSLYCALLAERAEIDPGRCERIRVASLMHDLGKIGVPDQILYKPGRLTPEEYEVMKRHTEYGHEILSGSDDEMLELAAAIALNHHERMDGTGYPRGLGGERIPIEGRIAAVADVFDALTSDRPYRPSFGVERAVQMMREGRGTQFDPALLDLFLAALDEVLEIRRAYSDPGAGAEEPFSASLS